MESSPSRMALSASRPLPDRCGWRERARRWIYLKGKPSSFTRKERMGAAEAGSRLPLPPQRRFGANWRCAALPEEPWGRFRWSSRKRRASAAMLAPIGGGVRAATAATAPIWGKLALCGLAGGALGSIPVVVKEKESVSSDVGAYWVGIPGGIGAGVLICRATLAPSPSCSLGASPQEVSLGDAVTLSWSSPRGYQDYLSDLGPQPSSGSLRLTPSHAGVNSWELTAKGALGTLVCKAEVKVKEAPCKFWYTTEDGKDFVLHWELAEDATNVLLKDQASGQEWKNPGFKGDQAVSPETGRKYALSYTVPVAPGATKFNGQKDDGARTCDLEIPIPACEIRATKKQGRGFVLAWSTPNTVGRPALTPPITKPGYVYDTGAETTPTEDTTYTLSVVGRVYKDSSKTGLGSITLKSSWLGDRSRN